MNILILGNFGYANNKLDGQTIKTRNVWKMLEQKSKQIGIVDFIDTSNLKANYKSIFIVLRGLFNCNKLIIIPGRDSFSYLFPFCFLFSLVLRFKIIHVGVGGWTDEFFANHKIHRIIGRKIRANLVENSQVKNTLENIHNFNNISIMPNFRNHNFIPKINDGSDKLKIVFFSRIMMEKGIDTVFEIAEFFNEAYYNQIIFDFYGQIEPKDKNYFLKKVKEYDSVQYLGELQPEKINQTLNNYDLLILPTKFYTEGFPGAVLDAYISGIPVLVSKWKHANEFVVENKSGYICEINDSSQFIDKINFLLNNRNILFKLKYGAIEESKKYSQEKAYQIISQFLK